MASEAQQKASTLHKNVHRSTSLDSDEDLDQMYSIGNRVKLLAIANEALVADL